MKYWNGMEIGPSQFVGNAHFHGYFTLGLLKLIANLYKTAISSPNETHTHTIINSNGIRKKKPILCRRKE